MLPHLKMLTVWEHFLEEFHEMGPREAAIGTLKAEPNGNVLNLPYINNSKLKQLKPYYS